MTDLRSLEELDRSQKENLIKLLGNFEEHKRYNKLAYIFPETGPLRRELYPRQMEFMAAGHDFKERALIASNRPLVDDTLVWMADGTKKVLKDVQVGDRVLSLDLKTNEAVPSTVVNIPFIGVEECYRIEASRGYSVTGTADHCFPIWSRSGKQKRILKLAISEMRIGNSVSQRQGFVAPKKISFESADYTLPIHPYVLGCLIGDGTLRFSSVQFTNVSLEVLTKFKRLCDYELKQSTYDPITYSVMQGQGVCLGSNGWTEGPLNQDLRKLGLKVSGKDKHIPQLYLTASEADRLELLAGLIDTDGTSSEFTSKSEQLTADFCTLVKSLGGYARYQPAIKTCTNTGVSGVYYRAYYRMPYRLPLALEYKQPKLTKRLCDYSRIPITKRVFVGKRAVRCITVDHPDHTFIINDGLATFNSGKTVVGMTELSYHLTGDYPSWWKGKRFHRPIQAWAVGNRNATTRDILQVLLLGSIFDLGSGLIPKEKLLDDSGNFMVTTAPGIPGAKQDVYVKHKSGGLSKLGFKSYEQGRQSFEGTALDLVCLDEECPQDVYTECLTRTMTTGGLMILTFTPLLGFTDLVLTFLPNHEFPGTPTNCGPVKGSKTKWVSRMDWSDVPHIPEKEKAAMLESYAPHELEARSKGIPSVGSGKVFPFPESELVVEPFSPPKHWPRVFGMSVGKEATAAIWGALDASTDTLYLYKEYKVVKQLPPYHAAVIKANAGWIPGVINTSNSTVKNKRDNYIILNEYLKLGLALFSEDMSLEASVLEVFGRLASGRLKVMGHLTNWLNEFRMYARDENHNIVQKNDELIRATCSLSVAGTKIAMTNPDDDPHGDKRRFDSFGKNSITGY